MTTLHPPIERLAELMDGTPTLFEGEHLASCAQCARELEAYRRLVTLAAEERRRIAPPLTSWESLRAGLEYEHLITDQHPAVRRGSAVWRWGQRAAAALLMVAGGTIAGRMSAGLPLGSAMSFGTSRGPDSSMVLVSSTGTLRSPQEALEQLERAQRSYEEAAAYLSSHDTSSSIGASDQYRTRLAALDMASETFERALTDAPEDPILNQYYMATMNAREVAIRRLGTTLPASLRMGRF